MKNKLKTDPIAAQIREARSTQQMSRQQLADKCGIPKYRISMVENDVGKVPVSILRLIIEKGLGGRFQLTFEF
ncbi:helix-turn-helix transcriptional regulator [Mucilaginibacter sp. 21P]|uniref:helix-turn-helix domain-containing protein n=1 Tax=Mucilaginibacter sp. 21P TaxID=2778902 RepID=UPI001C562909|nr:helix-turn-helix transcriptional regulator [Mucilaginibacter sp. 21P]QXV64037.1 helix-turn-helix transcriptional regulator [Mucilaginibacter sp. 21P]